ncbi:MAG: hypothetical protein LH650_11225, partial [Chloroflexi bacterium]|nr:hypothetical protein [Chloroflexota bacterium]
MVDARTLGSLIGRTALVTVLTLLFVAPAATAQSPSLVPSVPVASGAPSPAPVADPVPGGLPWQVVAAPLRHATSRLDHVITWAGGFAVVQSIDERTRAVWHSSDGVHWVVSRLPRRARPQEVVALLAYRGGLVLAVNDEPTAGRPIGLGGWAFRLWRSADGDRWEPMGRFEARLPRRLDGCQLNDRNLVVADGRLVAIAAACRDLCCGLRALPGAWTSGPAAGIEPEPAPGGTFTWTSTDGRDWVRHRARGLDDVASGFLRVVSRVPDGLLGLLYARTSRLVRSADGVTWETLGDLPAGFDMDSVPLVGQTPDGYLLAG